jgi:hypothetical protein
MLCMCDYGEVTRACGAIPGLHVGVDCCPLCRFPRGGPSRRSTNPKPHGDGSPIPDDRAHHPLTDVQLEMLRLDDRRIFGINVASKNVEDGYKHTHGHCTTCFIYLGCSSGGCTNTNLDTFKTPMEGPCNHCAEAGEKPLVRCNLADCKKCLEIYTPLEHESLRKERAREQELLWERLRKERAREEEELLWARVESG